jgi:hypothetical protein
VLGDAGGDGQHVRVEDDVLRREAGLGHQQVVRPAADLHLALDGVRLALLVESHDDHAGAVPANGTGLRQEGLLALLQADRVDDPLALQALQAGLEDRPLRTVDHHRDPGHLRLGRDEVEEPGHRPLAVEQVGIHVDVQQVGAAAHLLHGHLGRGLVVLGLDEPAETAPSRSRSSARRSSRTPCPARSRTAPGR